MKTTTTGQGCRALCLAAAALLSASGSLQADDTEIYQSTYSAQDTGRPKVLIIFDDSGSMGTNVTLDRPAYDPNATYQSRYDHSRIYWSSNGSAPGSGTSRWYPASMNRCAESYTALATVGYFQDHVRRYRERLSVQYTGTNQLVYDADWVSLDPDEKDITKHLDCQDDVDNANPGNGSGQADGYPFASPYIVKPNYARYRQPGTEYDAATAADSNVDWGSSGYTLYTGHYLDYLSDTSIQTTRTRLAIAQEVVGNLIQGNPGIDFGVVNFNSNSSASNSGGRVTKRIFDTDDKPTRDAYRSSLVSHVNGINASGWTPLCESTYEAYRYLAGESVHYGAPYPGSRDQLAEDPVGTYKSPATNCAYTYVILMTDGLPTYDEDANAAIESLTGKTCNQYRDDHGSDSYSKNCLPELAEYMATTDLDGDTTNGNQFGITYTIGFTTNQTLLSDTATKGKGQYFTADSADELTAAFQGAILAILSTDSTFTSPSVAVDSFNRTQSRNDVYFAMFKPIETTDWRGNIKKLKLAISNGTARLEDRDGDAAIDPSNGQIKVDADTYWSTADGGDVEKGGIGGLLAARDPATRSIKTNSGTNGALEDFSSANLDAQAFGFDVTDPNDPTTALFDFFGVNDQAGLDAAINYGKGYDVAPDGTISGTRQWILADMLHSKPVVVNYGTPGAFTDPNEPDQRIVVGTNGGFLHMFGNDNGEEDWAFFPKELAPVLRQRQDNATSGDRVYGIDASPIVYTRDYNHDGTIDAANDGDKAYVYFGLRRGGRLLYALDISTPGSPAFMWQVGPTTAGFGELGQTWSNPVVTHIPGYVDNNNVRKPVLIFGAGYDENKDATGVATPDTMGRGLFVVDATTGALIWSVTPAANSGTNLQETGLVHSVAGAVTTLDSNGDELTDRVYFADTGGNVWRVDMGGNALPTSAQDTWRIVKLAAMNGGTAATDRRFFNAPDVVRAIYHGLPIDAVLIGSGDRTNPNATDVSNEFYMIRDEQVAPYFTAAPSYSDCNGADPVDDFRCQLPLDPNDLYDVSANLIQDGTTAEQSTAAAALLAANGWRLPLPATGEKSLARSLTIDGKVYFTTFSPDAALTSICEPTPGTGRLYVVDLLTAAAEVDFDDDDDLERSWIIGSLIPDTPAPHFGSDGEIRLLLPPGSGGNGFTDNPFLTGATMPEPYGSYWYREEY